MFLAVLENQKVERYIHEFKKISILALSEIW